MKKSYDYDTREEKRGEKNIEDNLGFLLNGKLNSPVARMELWV